MRQIYKEEVTGEGLILKIIKMTLKIIKIYV